MPTRNESQENRAIEVNGAEWLRREDYVNKVYWAEARLGHYDATGKPKGYFPFGYAEDYEIATGEPFLPPWKPWLSRWRRILWVLTGGEFGI